MKEIKMLILLGVMSLGLYGQSVNVSGVLRDRDGNPLPGVSIVISGSTKGTVTNIDGFYEINAPLGSILVVSFIGMVPVELYVNDDGTATATPKNPQKKPNPNNHPNLERSIDYNPFHYDSTTSPFKHDPANGVAVLAEKSTYKIKSNGKLNYNSIKSLKLVNHRKNQSEELIVFSMGKRKYYYIPRITYSSTSSIESVTKLPQLQNKYVQGSPVAAATEWRGPETGEILAWGPKIENLKYDGSNYQYDKNGRLVSKGTGTNPPKTYNSLEFFRLGFSTKNSLKIQHKIKNVLYSTSFKSNYQTGTIPTSNFNRRGLDIRTEYKKNNTILKGNFTFSKVNSHLSGNSPITYHLMRAILLTPPSFDNTNGYANKTYQQEESYILSTGDQRSYSLNNTDNPNWLINNLHDELTSNRKIMSLKLKQNMLKNLTLSSSFSYNSLNNQYESGIKANSSIFPLGIFNNQLRIQNSTEGYLSLEYNKWLLNGHQIYLIAAYSLSKQKSLLDRNNFASFTSNIEDSNPGSIFNYSQLRIIHNQFIKSRFNIKDDFILEATAHQNWYSDYKNFQNIPGGSISSRVNFHNIFHIRPFSNMSSYCSYGNTFQPLPLFNDARLYSTLTLSENNLSNFFHSYELEYSEKLKPQETKTFNIGFDMGLFYNSLLLSMNWYSKTKSQSIFPVHTDDKIIPQNLGVIKTRGTDFSVKSIFCYDWFKVQSTLTFTKSAPIVEELYNNLESIPLAGFRFIKTNAIEGQPLGVITGSKYLRDQTGQLIIDDHGFPVVDSEPGIIGNPNPKWLLSLQNTISIRRFELMWLWDFRNKGDIWNGTSNTLDYYGLSYETGKERETRDFLYEGVTQNGIQNSILVDFANPINGLNGNKWHRYGITGVDEEAIEDGTSLRIREVKVSYSFTRHLIRPFKSLKLGLYATNLFVFSKYSGVDPDSSLLGSSGGYGLDYFNAPSNKSFGINIQVIL